MMPNNQQGKIYFNPDDIFSKISNILEKNGLHETPIVAALKESKSSTEIILQLTNNFISAKISEKDFSAFLQKQLDIDKETAQNILKDLKEKIIPLAEKVVPEEKKIGTTETEEEKTTITPQKPTTGEKQIKTIPPIIKTIGKKAKPAESVLEEQKIPEIKKISRTGPDNYRESIE
jgi:HD superfamily phosphohydrolase